MEALFELPARAETEWGLRRACQLALLRERLAAAGRGEAWAAGFLPAGWLDSLSVADLLRHATPFFWMNLGRCQDACTNGAAGLDVALRHLLMTGFDALFAMAPDGFSCQLPATDDDVIVLPRLRLRLAGPGAPARLSRVGRTVLRVENSSGQPATIDLGDVPANAELACLPVGSAGSARLLLSNHPALCPRSWAADVPADPDDPAGLAAMIGAALELIHAVDPRRGEQIAAAITWYLPLIGRNPDGHRSRTAANLRGVLFLSPGRDQAVLAEAIVHEYYHSVLHARMEVEPLLAGGDERRFYSPWREDPRPLAGLLHALYVHAGVAEFCLRAEQAPRLARQAEAVRARRRRLVAQLRLGHAQVPGEDLTGPGRKLLEELAAIIARHEADLGLSPDKFPDDLVAHWRKWRAANAHLAAACAAR
jgi:HEXXH motif-containing protein